MRDFLKLRAFENLAQLFQSQPSAGVNRAEGFVQLLGNLAATESLKVRQFDHPALCVGQSAQRRANLFAAQLPRNRFRHVGAG